MGLAVVARRGIKEGETLCRIPKSALLSIRNTGAADIIEEERLGGGLGLVFAVLYEMCRGEESRWHGYFLSMPSREYLPIFWTDEELETLKGTELEERCSKDRCCCQLHPSRKGNCCGILLLLLAGGGGGGGGGGLEPQAECRDHKVPASRGSGVAVGHHHATVQPTRSCLAMG